MTQVHKPHKICLVVLLLSFVCALGCQEKKKRPRRPKETPAQAKARSDANVVNERIRASLVQIDQVIKELPGS